MASYGVNSNKARSYITSQRNIIKEEIFKLKPNVSEKILILKNVDAIPKVDIMKLSF